MRLNYIKRKSNITKLQLLAFLSVKLFTAVPCKLITSKVYNNIMISSYDIYIVIIQQYATTDNIETKHLSLQ